MTVDRDAAARPEAVAAFTAIGWTATEWDDLHEYFTAQALHDQRAKATADWLEDPPRGLNIPLSPADIREMFTRHGGQAATVLTELAAGISERFTLTFLDRGIDGIKDGWLHAGLTGLAETQATGWALTGYLDDPYRLVSERIRAGGVVGDPEPSRQSRTVLIQEWTDQFGPNPYLYVLAGITLAEAVAMRDAGTCPTEQQLRVMAALAGHTLPPGI